MKGRPLRSEEAKLLKDPRLRALADVPDAFAHTDADIGAKPDTYWEEMTRALTAPGRHVMLVAEDDGAPVGMAFGVLPRLRPQGRPDAPHLGGMWVAPAARRRGTGRATRTDRPPSNPALGTFEMERAL